MESKIVIDINYASRSPQIIIHKKESDDARDKLLAMFTGDSMPGVRDGYCRIERYTEGLYEVVTITPVHPTEMIKHIPGIAKLAEENVFSDTSDVLSQYVEILKKELDRVLATPDRPSLLPLLEQLLRPVQP